MNYPGGKGSCFRQLINLMPPHDVYIETHLGGGNILERKKPARSRNIGIDVDRSLIAEWSERRVRLPFALELHCGDAVEFLRAFPFKGGELVYSDPPYLHSTRRTLDLYRHEYSDAQHFELLETLVRLPCLVMVSGYESSLYWSVLERRHGWRCVLVPNTTRRGRVVERVWCNFPDVDHRHDCRYVGENFRERERIKRKRNRWRAKFKKMGEGERQVVLEALLELEPTKTAMPPANEENGRVGSRRVNDLGPTRYCSTTFFDDGIPSPLSSVPAAIA